MMDAFYSIAGPIGEALLCGPVDYGRRSDDFHFEFETVIKAAPFVHGWGWPNRPCGVRKHGRAMRRRELGAHLPARQVGAQQPTAREL